MISTAQGAGNMRRRVPIVVGVIACMIACTTVPPFTSSFDDPYGDGLVSILAVGLETTLAVMPVPVASGQYSVLNWVEGVSGVALVISNNSDDPVFVHWDRTCIDYNGFSHMVFLSGQKYMAAGTEMPTMTISGRSKLLMGVFPAENARYTSGQFGGWTISPIDSKEIALTVCLSVKGVDRFYRIRVDIEEPPET